MLHVEVHAPGTATEALAAQLAELTQQLGLAAGRPAVVAAPSLRAGLARFAHAVRADMVVVRVGPAGLHWLWPAGEVAAEPALPPVLTFRLAGEA